MITALWHWYQKYLPESLQLIKDVSEIAQEPPITSFVTSKSAKIDISQSKALHMSQASAKLEELLFKKFEEEKKGAPDSEEEKKEEVPVNALPLDPLEREAAMNALE